MYIAELFQGPTLAFKDLSLAVLAKLLEIFLKKKV
jgi:threonine synthase